MPATVVEEPLGIACVFSDGRRAAFRLDGLPEPQLARDLLVGLIELIHPHGTVDAAGSVEHFVSAIRHMVRTLAERGFSGGAGQLHRAKLRSSAEWASHCSSRRTGRRGRVRLSAAVRPLT